MNVYTDEEPIVNCLTCINLNTCGAIRLTEEIFCVDGDHYFPDDPLRLYAITE